MLSSGDDEEKQSSETDSDDTEEQDFQTEWSKLQADKVATRAKHGKIETDSQRWQGTGLE